MFDPVDLNPATDETNLGSPELTALGTALAGLLAASSSVTDAVTRHDRLALERANEQAEALLDEIRPLSAALTPLDRQLLPHSGITDICERLAAGSRRNAYLIEQAWAVDAALMRLMLGLGKVGADGSVGGYSAAPGPAYFDRQA
jgi:hypothetical protein